MPYLTYDIGKTLQLLSQPTGPGASMQAIGGALQNFAQMKQQKELNDMKLATMQVQKDLASSQLSSSEKQNQLLEWQTVGDSATGMLGAGNSMAQAAFYSQLKPDDPLKKMFGKNVPSATQLQALKLRGVGAKTVYSTEQARLLEEQKARDKAAQETKPKIPPTSGITKQETAMGFIAGKTVGDTKDTISDEMSSDDQSKIATLLSDTANKLQEQARQNKQTLSESEARQMAWDKIQNSGIIEHPHTFYPGNNYAINEEKYSNFLRGGSEAQRPDFKFDKEYTDASGKSVYLTPEGKYLYADGTEYKAE